MGHIDNVGIYTEWDFFMEYPLVSSNIKSHSWEINRAAWQVF